MSADPWTSETTVDAAGVPIFFRETGSGPPIVLLHGFPETGRCWRGVASRLGATFRVLVPDLPGYGRSGRPEAFDAATLARTIVSFMAAAAAPRAVVVGHDWGGGIAYRIAGSHSDAVERLVVVDSPYRELDLKRGWYMLAFNVPVLPELAFTASRGRIVDVFLRLGASQPGTFNEETLAAYRRALRPLDRRRNALAYYRTMTRHALLRAARRSAGASPARIRCPTMIVWGEDDPAVPVMLVRGIARDIPQARVETLPGIGHFVPEEAPEQLARLIVDFGAQPSTTNG